MGWLQSSVMSHTISSRAISKFSDFLTTKGESIEFSTPTIEGTVFRRNKVDAQGNHPWKAEVSDP